jgi:hypothetical protein
MSYSTTKLDGYNRNGDRLCDAFGCRKHSKLKQYRGGWFCNRHCVELEAIRARIDHSGSEDELAARQEELRFRKVFHPGHVLYAAQLEREVVYKQ